MGQHRSATAPDYRTDFFGWTQHQAELLRVLKRLGSSQLPDGLELDRLAEEVRDLGGAELNSVKSFMRLIMVCLIKAASDPDARAAGHWRAEAIGFHANMRDRYAPSMLRLLNMQELWEDALAQAQAGLEAHGASVTATMPANCPFSPPDFTTRRLDWEGNLHRLKQMLSGDG